MAHKRVGKVRPQDMPQQKRYRMIGEFFDIVDGLKSKKDIIDFFIGLLTPSESLMLARRIQIAKLIMNDRSYMNIKEELGAGNSTIANVDKWLQMRDRRYSKILSKHFDSAVQSKKQKKGVRYRSVLDRYPEHRILKKMLGLH